MNRLRILDTNRLIAHWCRSRRGPLASYTREHTTNWARKLIELERTSALLTPVVIEFLCGARDSHELELYRAYLAEFEVVDGGNITQADSNDATNRASRIPRDGRPRDFGDASSMPWPDAWFTVS
jgi:hypothetical protein